MALIGKNISHSKSKEMYEKILNEKVSYTLLDYKESSEIPNLSKLLQDFPRISITAPYKNYAFDNIDYFKENILDLESVNAIKLVDRKVLGTNTDILAFKFLYERDFSKFKNIFILGDGNMSQMAQKYFQYIDKSYEVYSRNKNNLQKLSEIEISESLIINCCSREYQFSTQIQSNSIFWDMNYNLKHHQEYFTQNNMQYRDGIELLELQAKFALSFWN